MRKIEKDPWFFPFLFVVVPHVNRYAIVMCRVNCVMFVNTLNSWLWLNVWSVLLFTVITVKMIGTMVDAVVVTVGGINKIFCYLSIMAEDAHLLVTIVAFLFFPFKLRISSKNPTWAPLISFPTFLFLSFM